MSTPQVEIRTVTAGQLSHWTQGTDADPILDQGVITRTRAWAIAHNPYVKPDDPVLAAVLEDGTAVAFTALFPDRIGDRPYVWFSTLWCHPDCLGRGYSLLAVGTLMEHYGTQSCLDSWGAPETVEIFHYFGHRTTYFAQYKFALRTLHKASPKVIASYCLKGAWLPTLRRNTLQTALNNEDYTLEYTNHIDDETYSFISRHSSHDLIPRTQAMLNWILACPFKKQTPLMGLTVCPNPFPDNERTYWISGVKVIKNGQTIAFYMLRQSNHELSVKYLYYDPQYTKETFDSILQHIINLRARRFTTRCKELADHVSAARIFNALSTESISYSLPPDFAIAPDAVAQGGDSDAFV